MAPPGMLTQPTSERWASQCAQCVYTPSRRGRRRRGRSPPRTGPPRHNPDIRGDARAHSSSRFCLGRLQPVLQESRRRGGRKRSCAGFPASGRHCRPAAQYRLDIPHREKEFLAHLVGDESDSPTPPRVIDGANLYPAARCHLGSDEELLFLMHNDCTRPRLTVAAPMESSSGLIFRTRRSRMRQQRGMKAPARRGRPRRRQTASMRSASTAAKARPAESQVPVALAARILDEEVQKRQRAELHLSALAAYLMRNDGWMYDAALDWFANVAKEALCAYAQDGIDAGEDSLRRALANPARFERTKRRQRAYTIYRWYTALKSAAKPIFDTVNPGDERQMWLCCVARDVRDRYYWALGGDAITPDTLPVSREPSGFAKAVIGRFFLPPRTDSRANGRDRRSVGATIALARKTIPTWDFSDLPAERRGLDRLFADVSILPSRLAIPRALLSLITE